MEKLRNKHNSEGRRPAWLTKMELKDTGCGHCAFEFVLIWLKKLG